MGRGRVPCSSCFELAEDPEHLYLLVLDEMNLAHVERYFADVLSGMESGEPVVPVVVAEADGHWRVRLDGPPTIPVPANLLIVGTVNIDETTYQFSPKVLDRAFTFDFRVQTSELTSVGAAPTAVAAAEPSALDDVAAALRVLERGTSTTQLTTQTSWSNSSSISIDDLPR